MAEIDESIHVSRTSASPLNSFAPHSQASGGCVRVGSSGSHSSFATFVFPHPEQYHAGIGVANILCLEMHQSHSIVPVPFSSRTFISSGTQVISLAVFRISSWIIFTNHCLSESISIGVLHRQHKPTFWGSSSCLYNMPSFNMSSIIAFLHCAVLIPANFPASSVIFPVLSIAFRRASLCSTHHRTSCLSPKVHIMTTPVPNVGSTFLSEMTFTL